MKKHWFSMIAAILSAMALCLAWEIGHGTQGTAVAAPPDASQSASMLTNASAEPRETGSSIHSGIPLRLLDEPPPPLPSDCTILVPPGEDPPAACVYGYVYLDGLPVSGASVIIRTEAAILSVSTQNGPASPVPYFVAVLTTPPLSVSVDELVKVDATYSDQSNTTTFTVVEDGQEVDLWLSSTCGPTLVPGGIIGPNTTWSPDCGPYIVTGSILVMNGITLTVEAGTTVRFDADTALQVDGVLDARGAANAMITFTSNGDGAPGDWGYIYLHETLDPIPFDHLRYVLIEYAGGANVTDNAALRVSGAWPGLSYLTVRHSASDGVRFYNGAIGGIGPATIYDNAGWGIHAVSASLSSSMSVCVYHNAGGGIYIEGAGPVWIAHSNIWENGGRGIEARGTALDLYVISSQVRGNRASNGGGIFVYYATLDLSDSWISGNVATSSTDGGGIYCSSSSTCQVHNNVISANSAGDQGGGIYIYGGVTAYPHEIEHNIFTGNEAASGGGLAVVGGQATTVVANNAFLDNTATGNGAAIYVTKDIAITENTILHNNAGLGLGGIYVKNHPVINFNNLYENSDYDFYNGTPQGAADVNAEYNWWGTSDYTQIMTNTWDWFDDPSLGLVDFDPWYTSHFLYAPVSPLTGLVASSDVLTVTLTWSPNPEADLAGYKVYYDTDGPGFPYDGTGASQGDAPIDVGNVLSATLTGLAPGTYYISVTAYDTAVDGVRDQTDGNESWFAYDVTAHVAVEANAEFSATPASGNAPLIVNFTNGSTGDFDTCAWTFGDGVTSSSCNNPTHTYEAAGTFTVTLTVSGSGGMDTLTRLDYITVYPPEQHFVYLPLILRNR
jgi:predicted outer membrane repeat protein